MAGTFYGRLGLIRPRRFEIRIAGFGGQGVVTIGKILGTAFSVYGGKNSVNTQSYGPESRGGACRSEVIVSDGEINYPYVREADVLVALSQVALDAYGFDIAEDGILLIDPQAVTRVPKARPFRLYQVPTVEIAHATGDMKCQNTVALGALYALIADMIGETALLGAIEASVPPATLALNRAAFEQGKHYVRSHFALEK
jgi:2-oxoglutarate ferredoxin oxidoreductase subunit gamma